MGVKAEPDAQKRAAASARRSPVQLGDAELTPNGVFPDTSIYRSMLLRVCCPPLAFEMSLAEKPTPPSLDGGSRAWLVVAGAWSLSFVSFGIINSFGWVAQVAGR